MSATTKDKIYDVGVLKKYGRKKQYCSDITPFGEHHDLCKNEVWSHKNVIKCLTMFTNNMCYRDRKDNMIRK